MPTSKTCYKVILASPGDVPAERTIVSKLIDEINNLKKSQGIGFDLYRWETDAHTGFHPLGPQGRIDEALRIEDADILIGIFYLRFGTQVYDAESGTEHEINKAIKAWEEKGTPEIKLYFKDAPVNPSALDIPQFEKVKQFKKTILEKGLIKDFCSKEEFEDSIRNELLSYIDKKNTLQTPAPAQATPAQQTQPHTYPKPSKTFTGRKIELAEFKTKYDSSNIIAIEGIGGTGKTEFSAKCIEEFINDKTRLVWFVCHAGSKIDALIEKAGFPDVLKGENKTEQAKYSGFTDLIEMHGKVIFIDNFQDADESYAEFLHFAEKYLKNSKIILISREHPSSLKLGRIKLEGLKQDSFEYAKKLIAEYFKGINIDDHKLKNICEKVGGHPFAIEQALRLLDYGESPENILKKLDSQDFEKLSQRLLDAVFNHPKSTDVEKRFLLDFSIFRGSVTRECINEVISGESWVLRKLIDKLMITPADGLFEAHPLIREFCYAKNTNKKQAHLKAAEFYKKSRTTRFDASLEDEIIYHLYMAEAFVPAADIVCETGEEFILTGHTSSLFATIENLKGKGVKRPSFDIFLGDIFTIRGEFDKALSLYEKAFSSDDEKVNAEAYIKYGETFYRRGLIKESLRFFEDAYEICKKIDFHRCEARSLNNIGLVQDFFGKPEALENLHAALKIRERIGDKSGIANSLNCIGIVLGANDDLSGALKNFEESLKIEQEIGNKSGIASSLNNIGLVLQATGDLPGALKKYEESLKIRHEIGDKLRIASSLNNIGLVLQATGDLPGALKKFKESLKIEQEIGDKTGVASSLNNIGSVLSEKDDLSGVLKKYTESLKISQEIGNKSGIANSLHNIGAVYFKNGEKAKAFTFLALRRFMWVDFNPRVLLQPCLARLFCIQGSLKT